MATRYSAHQRTEQRPAGAARLAWLWLALAVWAGPLPAEAAVPGAPDFGAQARQAYVTARTLHESSRTNLTAAWEFASACFEWAEFASNATQRAALAQEGIAVSRWVVEQQPGLAAGHYYLAMNLGQLARTKSLGALRLVSEMEKQFQTASELEATFDHAGPDRSLGLLYRDAPGWPTSVGSRAKARRHLQHAVELCPDFPENRLCLLETLHHWGEAKTVQAELPRVARALTRARASFTGDAWAASWADWDRRWEVLVAAASPVPIHEPANRH
jgi:hypothetical protein